jgi:outer membrane lipoprotein carrier protein
MDHAKFWFHHRRLTTDVAAFSILLSGLTAASAFGQQDDIAGESPAASDTTLVAPADDLPSAFGQFLDTVDSFKARFVQELWSDDQRLIDVAEGDVELLRPGRFRWHYEAPYEQFVVADGETLWMYDVDISQVTRSRLDANDAGNPGALLTGDRAVMDGFDVVETGSDDAETWVTLAPRSVQSDYSRVRVAFTPEESGGVLSELEFVDGLNQTTVIHFMDAEINPDIGPERFEFEVPPDAHVLGGPG